jgi:NADPH:quinone reductase-like Zn-dependent oxidoreductase
MIRQYGAAADVLKTEEIEPPTICDDEVLIRQFATSVNPIDCRMRSGYGRVIFSKKRGFELPLVLGRDVSGEVVKVGAAVKTLSVGDAVYGVPATKAQGAYAELVVAKANEVVLKPQSLSFTQAAALPYVGCTVWDALVTKAGLNAETAAGKRVFVQGGAGGIGSFAIQVLKAWGAYVATTCNKAQISSVAKLGADFIVDYEKDDYALKLSDFDVALETIGGALEAKTLGILKTDGTSKFVTLSHPILQTFDQSGIVLGALKNIWQFSKNRRLAKRQGVGGYSWALFKPSPEALNAIRGLVEGGHLLPHIDRELALSDMVQAHQYCEQGKSNGKVIIRIQ